MATALEHPDFSVVLQKAMLSAAQTENQNKHELLSRLVAERIQAPPESLVSMASKMACDAISFTTPNQLLILGLLTNILYIVPSETIIETQKLEWIQTRVSKFLELNLRTLDLDCNHLESLSCTTVISIISNDLPKILSHKFGGAFDFDTFKSKPTGEKLVKMWKESHLQKCNLTTVGQILGVMVSDQHLGDKTSFAAWSRER